MLCLRREGGECGGVGVGAGTTVGLVLPPHRSEEWNVEMPIEIEERLSERASLVAGVGPSDLWPSQITSLSPGYFAL